MSVFHQQAIQDKNSFDSGQEPQMKIGQIVNYKLTFSLPGPEGIETIVSKLPTDWLLKDLRNEFFFSDIHWSMNAMRHVQSIFAEDLLS